MPISYTAIATIVWLIVAVLIGLNIVTFFYWPPRYAVFTVAAAMGIVLLLRVNLRVHKKKRQVSPKQLPAGTSTLLAAHTTSEVKKEPVTPTAAVPSINPTPVSNQRKLSPNQLASEALTKEAAREWLDNFLVQQQKRK